MRRQTYGYLPSRMASPSPLDRYRTILLGDIEAHVCEQLAQGCYLKVERPGIEPATFDDALTITPDTPPRDSEVIL